ncbi:DUF1801 domain-containing protein [Flavobacteriaceae bacterium]|jgi:uncharacterized protein YdhG (YjbR/CyaY superfamily)|nr:DUF1801 domain-containing protein [Flavobacteriaceae bacterium]MDA7710759.1 DUF1801 domain-containing protein [Flavobacteriaceae bacterium]MDA8993248.1 DUF1801 domain-containing protein [Flavobacteriaceae bacterium]MDB4306917.1 DUF1801 domain-containing protein [Flavobacteriaceae bacterium]
MYQHTQAANIAEYIALAAPSLQEKLHQIRDLVHSALPEVEEKISYDMPTFKYQGKILLHFAAQKKHIGLYALPATNVQFATALKDYKTGKGSIQIPNDKDLPLALIADIIQFRKAAIEEQTQKK